VATTSPDRLNDIITTLRSAGCVFAEEEATLLIESTTTDAELDAAVRRRVTGEPIEYILGWAEFYGLRIAVEAGVFVPRRRTGWLVEVAARLAPPQPVLLDMCCGTGALGAALLTLTDRAELYAADLEPAAVRCARRNLGDRATVFEGDLFAPLPSRLRNRVDVLIANAPYVPTGAIAMMPPEARDHELRTALDGGADGLDVQRRIAAAAPEWLRAGGILLIETGTEQAPATAEALERNGMPAKIESSEEWDATVVIGTRPTG
jgi:release factor glutamine methyltransferase